VLDENDPNDYTGAANPDKVDQQVFICVAAASTTPCSSGPT